MDAVVALSKAVAEGEDGGEDVSARTHVNVVLVIMLCVVVVSVSFETAKEKLYESMATELREVVEVLFGELTLLGFIGLLIFILSKFHGLSDISSSKHVFGPGNDDELQETIENVHFVLFFVMVLFIGTIFVFVLLGGRAMKKWKEMEVASMSPGFVAYNYANATGSRCGFLEPGNEELTLIYASLRHEFLSKRTRNYACVSSHGHGHKAHQSSGVGRALPPGFDFSEYLGVLLGHTLAELVEVPPTTWVVLLILLASVSMGATLAPTGSLIMFAALGCLVPTVLLVTHAKMRKIQSQLVHPGLYRYAASFSSVGVSRRPNKRLAAVQADLTTPLNADVESYGDRTVVPEDLPGPTADEWDKVQPSYLQAVVHPRKPGCARRIMGPTPNKHELLFWLHHNGPEFLVFLFRLLFISNSIYLGMVFAIVRVKLFESDLSTGAAWLIFLALLIPSFIFFYCLPSAVRLLVIVCNVEHLKRPKTINVVHRIMRTRQSLRALRLIVALKGKAHSTRSSPRNHSKPAPSEAKQEPVARQPATRRSSTTTVMEMKRQKEVREAFSMFDKDGSGSILTSELTDVLCALGWPTDDAFVSSMIDELDTNQDGTVDFEEFYAWTIAREDETPADQVHDVVEFIFEMIDKDGSGSITPAELRSALDSVGEALSYEDVTEIIKEFDRDEDGHIDKEEFEEMLKKHVD